MGNAFKEWSLLFESRLDPTQGFIPGSTQPLGRRLYVEGGLDTHDYNVSLR